MTTLVLGGTGKTGRRVLERLAARDLSARVGSRLAEPPFDWDQRDSWAPALQDVDSVYVSYFPDLAFPVATAAVQEFAELAVARGAGRLVLLSRRGDESAGRSEDAVRRSGADWTIVRASWLNQNFSEGHLLYPVLGGEVALPARQLGEPFVDADDVADVAVEALTEDGHSGRVYELTGPRLLTFAEAVEEIAEASGREIRYARVSMSEYTSLLAEQHVSVAFVSLLRYLFAEIQDGRNAHLADGVQRALGREPRDFADYVRATAATGVWDVNVSQRGA